MEYLIGAVLGVVVCGFARVSGFDRDRVFYPTLLTTFGTYYILFAVMGGTTRALIVESLGAAAFAMLAVAGFKGSLWVIVAGLIGHGVFDFLHHLLIRNSGVPDYWPGFCGTIDVFAGGFLAVLLVKRPGFASARSGIARQLE